MTDPRTDTVGNMSSVAPTGEAADGGAALPPLLRTTLLLAMVAPALSFVTLPPALPLLAASFGGGANGQAIAQGAQALSFAGGALGGVLSGFIIGLLGLQGALRGAALVYALAGSLAMLAIGPAMLLPGTFAVGFAGSLLSSGLAMATGAELRGERRTRMLGYQAATSDVCPAS